MLCDLAGDTMLARVISRVRAARLIDSVVVATTTAASDDADVRDARPSGAIVTRGSENDVLSRYIVAAAASSADVIVRVTSDCPLIDPDVIDAVVGALGDDVDYASNTISRSYPRGLDVEALHADTLARLGRIARTAATREHVTAYVMSAPERFTIRQVRAQNDDSDLRWTVDTAEDMAAVRAIYTRCDLAKTIRPYREVVAAVRRAPELGALNAHVVQKPWQVADAA